MAFSRRASGILLHPTSLPGRFGIGDLGQEAYRFVDFLVESGQQVWQVLPLGPTGYGNSPYLCYSALAGNPLLINLEWLVAEKLLAASDFDHLPMFNAIKADYEGAIAIKIPLLHKASQNFVTKATPERKKEFLAFCEAQAYWLDDYALFMAIKGQQNGASWHQWDEPLAQRDPQTLAQVTAQLKNEIFYHKYIQSEFFRQWSTLKQYANDHGVEIFGDIPIYVAHDSVDVWANPEIFCLDPETSEPAQMAGVPPDYFSETGQLWGNPVYNWEALQETHFAWWVQRIEGMLNYVDWMRIDHFRGFESFWSVPGGETVAIKGEWVNAPGAEFFEILKDKLGDLPIIAEDLGVITPEVEALRDQFGFAGMKVLHFAFDSGPGNPFLPFNHSLNCVVYSGTHDNDTTVGWFNARDEEAKQRVYDYFGGVPPEPIEWAMIRMAMSSVGQLSIYPLQDVLGLGTASRMNMPGAAEGNWDWRYQESMLRPELGDRLRRLTELYGRLPQG
ncbi:4-alpha-glucanotransferase [Spirulina sp. CCNP1310]|uniref:4-alpha-glucanotransferase n=1 Tax=Spirulina sp. CCNP1310 TaxID=3110249 RepID=UPI002B22126A|nr:4-alpha-glucanotransferase [Spirulina sp. CCNP1310]MEA5417766.1 4-alpha-glucanotransferase [Spirulina sp. CCNP1310]